MTASSGVRRRGNVAEAASGAVAEMIARLSDEAWRGAADGEPVGADWLCTLGDGRRLALRWREAIRSFSLVDYLTVENDEVVFARRVPPADGPMVFDPSETEGRWIQSLDADVLGYVRSQQWICPGLAVVGRFNQKGSFVLSGVPLELPGRWICGVRLLPSADLFEGESLA